MSAQRHIVERDRAGGFEQGQRRLSQRWTEVSQIVAAVKIGGFSLVCAFEGCRSCSIPACEPPQSRWRKVHSKARAADLGEIATCSASSREACSESWLQFPAENWAA